MENMFDIAISTFFRGLIERFGFDGKYAEILTIISGFFLFFAALAIYFLVKKQYRILGIVILASTVLTFILNDLVLKHIFIRPRPFMYFEMTAPGFYISSNSFPSGHSALTSTGLFSIVFYFIFLNKRQDKALIAYSIISSVICFLVMFSRIALLHHYLTDCLVGLLEGCLLALGSNYLILFIVRQIEKKKNIEIKL